MKRLISIAIVLILGCSVKNNSTVTSLDLSNKSLKSIPDSVFSMNHLKHLEVGNNFTLYPPLSALGKDSLSSLNKIYEIPKDIAKLQQLQFLSLRFNDLRALPKEILELRELDSLDISFNQNYDLANQYETLSKMQRLKYLNLFAITSDNNLIGKLRTALPKTKIIATLEDMKIETAEAGK